MQFKKSFPYAAYSLSGSNDWKDYDETAANFTGPRLLRAELTIDDANDPKDTYFDYDCSPECTQWKHGAFFVNGFNIGRYHQAGPQKTLYIPGPLLKQGVNEVIICSSPLSRFHKRLKSLPKYMNRMLLYF